MVTGAIAKIGPVGVQLRAAGTDIPLELTQVSAREWTVESRDSVEIWVFTQNEGGAPSCFLHVNKTSYPGNPIPLNAVPVCVTTICLTNRKLTITPRDRRGKPFGNPMVITGIAPVTTHTPSRAYVAAAVR